MSVSHCSVDFQLYTGISSVFSFHLSPMIEYYPLSVFSVLSLLGFQTYYRSKKNIFSWIYLFNSYNHWLVLYLFFSKGKYEFFKWMTDVYTSFSMMLSGTGRRLSLRIITGSTSGDYVILPAHQSILGFLEVLWFIILFFFQGLTPIIISPKPYLSFLWKLRHPPLHHQTC